MSKYVYSFSEGSKELVELLGSKGADLAEMANLGLPVPFGFTLTTEACRSYYENRQVMGDEIKDEVRTYIKDLEEVCDRIFGNRENPLLISIRSGAVVSMPGMMDTILNLGLNDETVEGLAEITGDRKFAYDTYVRLIRDYGSIVMGVPKMSFASVFEAEREKSGLDAYENAQPDFLIKLIELFKQHIKTVTGKDFPQDTWEQLFSAISSVFNSWNTNRAVLYRKAAKISGAGGTAVNVQAMVFGNLGKNSCTGVAFTRNPSTGTKELFGEYVVNAQGEDLVEGIRTPLPISKMAEEFPECYQDFVRIAELLEKKNKDMQDLEFTVERNKLYILQSRAGKRTIQAAVKIACDMESEGLIDKKTAIMRIDPRRIPQLVFPQFVEEEYENAEVLSFGLPASPGAATGRIYFNTARAVEVANDGAKVILTREETSPEDIAGIIAAEGILTARGGITSHAAVVARGIGRPCVAGCSELDIDYDNETMTVGSELIREGDWISIDGSTGRVMKGIVRTVSKPISQDFKTLINWAKEIKTLTIRANADNAEEAKKALDFGVQGIGLCRTEHMFFNEERIPAVRRMILAADEEERNLALSQLLPFQKGDFKELFKIMEDRPVTIRLLDPPLHEFLPQGEAEIAELAKTYGVPLDILRETVEQLNEINPMLGRRGCRLAITYPEITKMQVEAIISAAIEVKNENGIDVNPEIMIPLVSIDNEFKAVKGTVDETCEMCFEKYGVALDYKVGTMIETPRACILSDTIASDAEFFSFGTNDLTQLTYGFSRDDSGAVIFDYQDRMILAEDPFSSLDMEGVGFLIETAIEKGLQARPNIKFGICGEQVSSVETVEFSHRAGINYISCSPLNVPKAVITAAQAAIKYEKPE